MNPARLLPLALGLAAPAWAQPLPGGGGPDAPAAPQRIEIRGEANSDSERRRRDPVAKTVVGREELDKYDDPSIADVLKRQPGVQLQGGNPRMRGLGAGYTLVLLNGEPAPPGFSLENLPPSQVERIEIGKGPSAEHSTQAVAGTINIILRQAPRQRQRELGLRLGYNRFRPTPGLHATWGDRLGDLGVSLPLSAYQWRGGTAIASQRLTRDATAAQGLQALAVDAFDHWWGGGLSFGPRLNWRVSDATSLEWASFVQRNEFRASSRYQTDVVSGTAPLSVDDLGRNAGSWQSARTGLTLNRRFADGARLEARVGAQAVQLRSATQMDGRDAEGRLTLVRDTQVENREQSRSSSGKFTQPWRENHTLAMGWDVEAKWRTEVRSVVENGASQLADFEARPFEAHVRRMAAFVQDEWQITPTWATYVGLRGETIEMHSQDAGAAAIRSRSQVLTPVLHLTHKFDAAGRDLLRASLTRSYKAPELSALLARPSVNTSYPVSGANPQSAPDRIGNPALRPELATGVDLALEKYLRSGGVLSVGVFHRRIQGLIRSRIEQQTVSWSDFPRWVSQPVNLESATSTGLELELKGRVDELWPGGNAPLPAAMNVRSSLSVYRSSVRDIPGPDNRLDQQQPWSMTLGFDHKLAGTPLGIGASLAFTPGYATQLTAEQRRLQGRSRSLDAYVAWTVSRDLSWRLSASNLLHSVNAVRQETQEAGGALLWDATTRVQRAQWNLGLSLKL